MKCLITGGCGFIGSNLIEFLLKKTDFELIVLDNLTQGKLEQIKNIEGFKERVKFIKGDIRDKEDVKKAIENCDYVVNLAAQTGVVPSMEDPFFDEDVNVKGLLNLLDFSVKNKIKKFIHASSAAPLGEQEMPLDENKIPQPLSPYGASKLAGEGYCSAFSGSFGLKTTILRFSNVYGPKSEGKGSVIPKFIRRINENRELIVFGDGEQTRDFVHVKDICNAIYLGLITDLENNFNLFQIGTGKETSINKLIELLKEIFPDKEIKVKYEESRPGEIIKNYTDISKVKRFLNFDPKIKLEDGLKENLSSNT